MAISVLAAKQPPPRAYGAAMVAVVISTVPNDSPNRSGSLVPRTGTVLGRAAQVPSGIAKPRLLGPPAHPAVT